MYLKSQELKLRKTYDLEGEARLQQRWCTLWGEVKQRFASKSVVFPKVSQSRPDQPAASHAATVHGQPFWRPLCFFWNPFVASVVSKACWCHPFVCLWFTWSVCKPSLLLFVVFAARLRCPWALSATFCGPGHLQDCFWNHF